MLLQGIIIELYSIECCRPIFHRHRQFRGMDLPAAVLICRRSGQGTRGNPHDERPGTRLSSSNPLSIFINGPMIVTPAKQVTGRVWTLAGSYGTCFPAAIGLISDPILKILLSIHPPWLHS